MFSEKFILKNSIELPKGFNIERQLWYNFYNNKNSFDLKKLIDFLIIDEQHIFAEKLLQKYNLLDPIDIPIDLGNKKIEKKLNLHFENKKISIFLKNFIKNIKKIKSDDDFKFLNQVGEYLLSKGDIANSKILFNKIIEVQPNNENSLSSLGAICLIEKKYELAESYLITALSLNEKSFQNLSNLGSLHRDLNNIKAAHNLYLLAYDINKNNPDILSCLAATFSNLNNFSEAERIYKKGMIIDENSHSLLTNYGTYLCGKLNYTEGLPLLLRAVKIKPNAITLNNIANVVTNYGEQKNSINYLDRALAIDPKYKEAYSNKLFTSNYDPHLSPQDLFELYKTINELMSKYLINSKIDESLKNTLKQKEIYNLGFVSADFNNHAIANFLIPLLSHISRRKFNIYLYSNSNIIDEYFVKYSDLGVMAKIFELSDYEVSKRIIRDKIDFLIDLSGHTSGNRLSVFKMKPAPLSATWIGYNFTTGMKEINFFLTDDFQLTEAMNKYCIEKPVSLGKFFTSFKPINSLLKNSCSPFVNNKFITFGTLTRGIRINDSLIKIWSQILICVPNSKLLLNSRSFLDRSVKNYIEKKFINCGIESSRLIFEFTALDVALSKIDIILDNFPHNSGTTLLESVYSGCPFITLSTEISLGRFGGSINNVLGLQEFNANSNLEYVNAAVMLANNTEKLLYLRSNLSEIVQRSLIFDHANFASRFENKIIELIEGNLK